MMNSALPSFRSFISLRVLFQRHEKINFFSPPPYSLLVLANIPRGFPALVHPPRLLHPLSFSLSIVDLASPSGVAPTRQDTRGTPGDSMDELFTRLCRSAKVSTPVRLQGHIALLTRITTKRKRRS